MPNEGYGRYTATEGPLRRWLGFTLQCFDTFPQVTRCARRGDPPPTPRPRSTTTTRATDSACRLRFDGPSLIGRGGADDRLPVIVRVTGSLGPSTIGLDPRHVEFHEVAERRCGELPHRSWLILRVASRGAASSLLTAASLCKAAYPIYPARWRDSGFAHSLPNVVFRDCCRIQRPNQPPDRFAPTGA